MSNIPISSLPIAVSLTGEEQVPLVQAGTTKRTTTGAISSLPLGQGTAASGVSFITVTSSFAALPNSRVLAAAAPVTLTDAGTSAAITIGFSTGTSGYVLTANGTSLAATFQAAPATGVTSVGLSGGTTGLTISNSPITTSGTMTIAGVLNVSNGGIGTSTLATGSVLLGQGTSPITVVSNATTGYVLTSTGPSGAPTFQVPTGGGTGTVTSVALTAPSLGLTVSGSPITTNGTLTLSGFLNGTSIATTSVTSTQIATNTIGFSKIQQSSGLSVIGVTGTAAANIGTITGVSGQELRVTTGGTTLAFSNSTHSGLFFSATGTFTPPNGIGAVQYELWGAGGGGGYYSGVGAVPGSGGGSSGYATGWFPVTPGAGILVTVGTGGLGGTVSTTTGGTGGTSIFLTASATGGAGGTQNGGGAGAGGSGSGGFLNIVGKRGFQPTGNTQVWGGDAPRGGAGGITGIDAGAASPGIQPGGGGGGASHNGTSAQNGAIGGDGGCLLSW